MGGTDKAPAVWETVNHDVAARIEALPFGPDPVCGIRVRDSK
jgi:anaerobic glycerol-3-phosphate dehydrogenase